MENNTFKHRKKERFITGLIFIIITLYNIIEGGIIFDFFLLIIFSVSIIEIVNIINNKKYKRLKNKHLIALISFCYIILSFISIKVIRNSSNGHCYTILLYLSLWLFDSISYITGRLMKGKKISIKISPKKTWNGFIAGIFFTILIYNVFFNAFFQRICILKVKNIDVLYMFTILVMSLIGDLTESYLKRSCRVKDSSEILNGHGGILDRLDSLLLTSIFLYSNLKIQHYFY